MTSHTQEAAALADAFNKALNAHDAAGLGKQLAENVTYWEANLPAPINGREAVEEHFRQNWTVFPDANIRSGNRIVAGEWLVDEVEWSGTQKGPIEMPGQSAIPATGKRAQGKAVSVVKTEKGKITRMNVYDDNLGFFAQLWLAPGSP